MPCGMAAKPQSILGEVGRQPVCWGKKDCVRTAFELANRMLTSFESGGVQEGQTLLVQLHVNCVGDSFLLPYVVNIQLAN